LEETGFLERKRVFRKGTQKNTTVVIKLLRPPNDEDLKNLSFRRRAAVPEQSGVILEEDDEGDDMMRDLELDLDFNDDEIEDDRIPPQWDPDRLFPNLAYEAIALAGVDGTDASRLRERTMGRFWKRPTESFISRLTDNWELSQPLHLRHLALIRDTTVTNEKRLVHYIYRTYHSFQRAVDAGQVAWEAVSREALKNSSSGKSGRAKKTNDESVLDEWGFQVLDMNDFHQRLGSATLTECNAAIVARRRNGPRWDNELTEMMKYQKKGKKGSVEIGQAEVDAPELATQGDVQVSTSPDVHQIEQAPSEPAPPQEVIQRPKTKQPPVPLLSAEQRRALNLPPKGRLGIHIENQIREHREKTGDPTSLPDVIYTDPADVAKLKLKQRPKEKKSYKNHEGPRLFTKEFRKAHGLPARGRLPQSVIEQYRRMERDEISGPESVQPIMPAHDGPDVAQQLGVEPSMSTPELSAETTISTHGTSAETAMSTHGTLAANTLSIHETPAENIVSTRRTATENRPSPNKKRRGSELERPPEAVKKMAVDPANSSTPVVENTATETDAAASPTIDSPVPSIEALSNDSTLAKPRVKSRIVKSTRVKPVPGADAVIKKFSERSDPGLYINPYATRPIPRGRPKKAFMAVFKLSRLEEFDWFLPDPSFVMTSSKSRKGTNLQSIGLSSSPELLLSQSHTVDAEAADADIHEESEVGDTKGHRSPGSIQAIAGPTIGNSPEAASQVDRVGSAGPHHPPSRHFPTQATWNAINAPHRPPYRSPYLSTPASPSNGIDADMEDVSETLGPAAEQVPIAESPSQNSPAVGAPARETQATSDENVAGDGTSRDTMAVDRVLTIEIPAVEVAANGRPNANNDVRSPDMRALGYKRRVKHGTFAKRGVVLGRGNVWRLRTLIVLDILERCNGVFPFNGEIVSPFFKLWDKGPGKKMSRPDRTTITNTINSMVEDPDNKIRKLVFRIPSLDRRTTVERYIIAWKTIPTTDPRIRALQHNMIKVYPHKYYPEEIRHLVGPDAPHRIIPEPKFDPTISVDGVAPSAQHKLDQRILSSAQTRQRRIARKIAHAYEKNELAQKGGSMRERLESLHPGAVSRLGATVSRPSRHSLGIENATPLHQFHSARKGSPSLSTFSDHAPSPSSSDSSTSSDDDGSEAESDIDLEPIVAPRDGFVNLGPTEYNMQNKSTTASSFMNPVVQFYPNTGTFSTNFGNYLDAAVASGDSPVVSDVREATARDAWNFIIEEGPFRRTKKRVRFADKHAEEPRKKRRVVDSPTSSHTLDDLTTSRDGTITVSDRDMNSIRGSSHKQTRRRQKNAPPTLAERLAGLTGNPDDPVYIAPKKKRDYKPRPWSHMKPTREKKEPVSRKPVEIMESADAFKKLCCALAVASSMSGAENSVDWTIIAKVYRSDRHFVLEKAKKLWMWIQRNMAEQLGALKSEFQSSYLEAYEKGEVDCIEDPETYDWGSLVQWTSKTCEYAEPPLPPRRDDLHDYEVEESQYRGFDRTDWALKNLAHVIRAQRVLKYAYASPLHTGAALPPVDDALRARSWIRANTATPQDVYDSSVAHNKLQVLSGTVLERTVADLVQLRIIRQRKLKRLLPGRNYDFAAVFALKYRRAFDQTVFIDAADFKKKMDVAFANPDPEKRFLTLSRTANDGTVMALLSLVSAGKVRLVPKLPPVNNELQAPTPRLSVWGFMEGDYVHRKIDRNRLFWDIHAVPGEDYPFGNPLQPSPNPHNNEDSIEWRPLPEPPLPGKHDATAPLPIWSSIDGHHVTWPWWYRILNLVLQGIMFQPGASALEIHHLCPPGTVEPFEVELVLKWLVSANAARESTKGTYVVEGGFWAAFGEKLIGTEADWFGEHVKRNRMPEMRQPWRMQFNLRSERVSALLNGETSGESEGQNGLGEGQGTEDSVKFMYAESHLQRPVRMGRRRRLERSGDGLGGANGGSVQGAQQDSEDVVMGDGDNEQGGDSDSDAESNGDTDAEGEVDDEMVA
jgi:transcription factor C subunit 3